MPTAYQKSYALVWLVRVVSYSIVWCRSSFKLGLALERGRLCVESGAGSLCFGRWCRTFRSTHHFGGFWVVGGVLLCGMSVWMVVVLWEDSSGMGPVGVGISGMALLVVLLSAWGQAGVGATGVGAALHQQAVNAAAAVPIRQLNGGSDRPSLPARAGWLPNRASLGAAAHRPTPGAASTSTTCGWSSRGCDASGTIPGSPGLLVAFLRSEGKFGAGA